MTSQLPIMPDLSLTFRFLAAANRLTLLATRRVKDISGLSLTEWRILVVLAQSAGVSAADVVRLTMFDKSVASRSISQLESAGLIRAVSDGANRRKKILWLTAQGAAYYQKIIPEVRKAEEQAWLGLSPAERLMLQETLSKLQLDWTAMIGGGNSLEV